MKKIIFSIFTLLLFVSITTSAFAQTWLDEYNSSDVLGVNDSDNPNRSADTNDSSRVETQSNLRRNDYNQLTENKRLSASERQSKIDEIRSLTPEEKCSRITENLQLRIDFYQNSLVTHLTRYQGIYLKLKTSVDDLSSQGISTNSLRITMVNLEEEISSFTVLTDEFNSKLIQARSIACSDSDREFRDLMSDSKNDLIQIRQKSKLIKSYIQNNVVNEIRLLISENQLDQPVSGTTTN